MLLPVLKNFKVAANVGFDYRFQWDQGVPPSSVPTNLSLYTAQLKITNYTKTTTYLTLNSGATAGTSGIFFGGNTQDPTNGTIDIVIIAADVASITVQNANYNLYMTPIAHPTQPVWLLYGVFTTIA